MIWGRSAAIDEHAELGSHYGKVRWHKNRSPNSPMALSPTQVPLNNGFAAAGLTGYRPKCMTVDDFEG